MAKVFLKAPARIGKVIVKTKGGLSNRIPIRKTFDAKRKELTESNFVDKYSPVNIL